jgi:hypothetical protein
MELRHRASLSEAEVLRKKVLILKTELNQAKLINYWGQWLKADNEGLVELEKIAETMRGGLD